MGEISPGVLPYGTKMFFLRVELKYCGHSGTYSARILTILEQQTWISVPAVTSVKNFLKFMCREFSRHPKRKFLGCLGGLLVISLQVKPHNFRRQESFQGIANISRMFPFCSPSVLMWCGRYNYNLDSHWPILISFGRQYDSDLKYRLCTLFLI